MLSDSEMANKKDFMVIKPSDQNVTRNYRVASWTKQVDPIEGYLSTNLLEGPPTSAKIYAATQVNQPVTGLSGIKTIEVHFEYTVMFKDRKPDADAEDLPDQKAGS